VTISVMTPRVLVLWDIDRTLIDAGGVDKQAWPEVCAELTGRPARQRDGSSGRTGPQILLAILTGTGVGLRRARELLPAALHREAGMLAARRDRLREQGRALPGAHAALAALAELPGITQTVVTGNIRPNAELKLTTFGLDGHIDFPAGAYGSDHAGRVRLVQLACDRAAALRGWPGCPGRAVVIGDSLRDVQAAREAGTRVVAVASGRTPIGELRGAAPDAVLAGLADTSTVIGAVLDAAAAGP
jgi:phosphoglycolate phosphatase-like HAD superfamily hydrolase